MTAETMADLTVRQTVGLLVEMSAEK
jgi:trimeric autotransporter adhesin